MRLGAGGRGMRRPGVPSMSERFNRHIQSSSSLHRYHLRGQPRPEERDRDSPSDEDHRTRYFIIGMLVICVSIFTLIRILIYGVGGAPKNQLQTSLIDPGDLQHCWQSSGPTSIKDLPLPFQTDDVLSSKPSSSDSFKTTPSITQAWSVSLELLRCYEYSRHKGPLNNNSTSSLIPPSSSSLSSSSTSTSPATPTPSSWIRQNPRTYYSAALAKTDCCQGRLEVDAGTCFRDRFTPLYSADGIDEDADNADHVVDELESNGNAVDAVEANSIITSQTSLKKVARQRERGRERERERERGRERERERERGRERGRRLSSMGITGVTSSTKDPSSLPMTIRCLPSFIIAGAMKAGTGELMRWLERHPMLRSGNGRRKPGSRQRTNEVHYFGTSQSIPRGGECGWRQYLRFFPDLNEEELKSVYTFEKSPDYLRSARALREIKEMMPSTRIILLLRNPTMRAASGFDHNCRHGRYVRLLRDVNVYRDVIDNDNDNEGEGGVEVADGEEEEDGNEGGDGGMEGGKEGGTEEGGNDEEKQSKKNNPIKNSNQSKGKERRLPLSGNSNRDLADNKDNNEVASSSTSSSSSSSSSSSGGKGSKVDSVVKTIIVTLKKNSVVHIDALTRLAPSNIDTGDEPKRNDRLHRRLTYKNATSSDDNKRNMEIGEEEGAGKPRRRLQGSRDRSRSPPKVSTTNSPPPPTPSGVDPSSNPPPTTVPTDLYTVLPYPCKATDLHEYYFGPVNRVVQRSHNANDMIEKWGGGKDELAYGFYDVQLERLLSSFPPHQVLILFQEEMWDDTLGTLRKVENFLGIPCFNFSSIALPSARPGYPPQRVPVGFREKVKVWTKSLMGPFAKASSSKVLQSSLLARTKTLLDELYRPHSKKLNLILDKIQSKADVGGEGEGGAGATISGTVAAHLPPSWPS